MNLTSLISMSNRCGSDPDMVLAGGGNTSLKNGSSLYVKCSGTRLSDITADGFAEMDRQKLSAALVKEYPKGDKEREAAFLKDMKAALSENSAGKRPSVEAPLHNLFPQKYVLHIHPALVNGMTCGKDGKKIARELFGSSFIWIPPYKPGYTLAIACSAELAAYKKRMKQDAALLMLENHGIFIAADTTEEIESLLSETLSKLRARVKRFPDLSPVPDTSETEDIRIRFAALTGGSAIAVVNREILDMTASLETAAPLLKPFTPDHIVYCKAYPLFAENTGALEDAFHDYILKNGYSPKVAAIPGIGAFASGKDAKDAATAALLFTDSIKVAVYAESFGGAKHMTDELISFIVHWEAESYRQKQA